MMRQRLHPVLMAIPAIAISFLFTTPSLQAGIGADSGPAASDIVVVQQNGRTVYVNDAAPRVRRAAARTQMPRERLMYWSVSEHRWKPVPPASHYSMRAARSAAAEVRSLIKTPAASASAGDISSPAEIDG